MQVLIRFKFTIPLRQLMLWTENSSMRYQQCVPPCNIFIGLFEISHRFSPPSLIPCYALLVLHTGKLLWSLEPFPTLDLFQLFPVSIMQRLHYEAVRNTISTVLLYKITPPHRCCFSKNECTDFEFVSCLFASKSLHCLFTQSLNVCPYLLFLRSSCFITLLRIFLT